MKDETKQEIKDTSLAAMLFLSEHPGIRGFILGAIVGFLVCLSF